MRKKIIRIIIITIIIAAIVAIYCIKNYSIFKYEYAAKTRFSNDGNTVNSENGDNIYFFHTEASDCILIESNGHYGLVDTSNRYSQTITDSNGAEYTVTQHESLSNQDYFCSGKDVANYIVNALGVDHIDFVIGTHGHSDHIGGVEEICNQKLSNGSYLIDNRTHYFYKTYYHMSDVDDDLDENGNIITRTGTWHNQAFVYRAIKSMQDRGAKIINVSNGVKISSNSQTVFPNISNITGNDSHLTNSVYEANDLNDYCDDYISFDFGNYNIRLYNLFTGNALYDENSNSILTLITKGNSSILLTGDINVKGDTEAQLAKEIHNYTGEIDLYKLAHHGNNYSNSKEVIDCLQPKYCVSTKGGSDPKAYLCERYYANKNYGTNFYETHLIDKAVVANIGNDNITFYELYDENNNSNNRDTYNPEYRLLEPRSIWRDGSASGWFDWQSYNYNNWMYLEEEGNSYKIKTGWMKLNGYWYFADENGLIQYGWNSINNNWYYFAGLNEIRKEDNSYYLEGAMVSGWQELDLENSRYWFYFAKNETDVKIEGTDNYYPEGAMAKGWQNLYYEGKNRNFYLSKGLNDIEGYPRGAMITGKHNVEYNGNKNYYYFCKETGTPSGYVMGEMLSNITYEGNYYNSSGVMVDNTAPEIIVAYSTTDLTNQNVIVTLTSNEEVQEIEGWTREENRKVLTKEYSENTTEEITVKDLVGNEAKVNVEINNIDKTGTGMTGVNLTNWIALKNEIENTGKTELVINLTNNESNNWTVDSKIVISSEQNVRLVVKGNIIAKRAEGFLDCFIENNGTLEIVPENENIYLTFDGNKEIVTNSTGSLIEVYNGYLNVKNMILRNNKKVASGGGMYVKGSQIIFDNVQISNNEGKGGGGIIILNNNSDTELNNVIIDNNTAISTSGGGIYAYGKLKITGESTRISNNTSKTFGGGIMVKNECTIEDGEISGNESIEDAGGGIRVDGKLTLNGGNIKNNSANIGGGGIDYNGGMFFYNNGTVENNQSNNASNYPYPNADIYPDMSYNVDWTKDESLNIYRIKPSVMKSFIRGTDIADRSTQGMTRTDKYIIFTSWKSNEDDTILNIVDRNSLRVLNSIGGFQFKHANGMTYNSKTGYVYILPTTRNLVKFKVNDETYEIEDLSYIECTRVYSGIAYDEDDDCYIAYTSGKIYILDSNYNEISSFDLIMQLTPQEVAYYNGHIYFLSFEAGNNSSHQVHSFNNKERLSSLIYEYDFEGNLIRSLYISREDFAGELESGYFEENGDLVVSYNIALDNKSTVSLLKSDVFSPEVTVEYSESNKTNQNVTVTITANEEIQEIEGWTLSTDKKQLTKVYSENKTEEVTIKDLVGNETKVNVEISNIDKIAPTANVEYSESNKTNQNVTVTITANEEIQGIEGWTLSTDKKQLTKVYSENKTEEVTIKDLVGNETKVNVEISNIDKIAPTANVEYSTTNLTNQNVTVTITANEEIQGIEGWTREENRKVLTKEYSENKTEEITIKDLVGNETKVNVEISNIDKVAPTANVEYSTMNLTNQNVTVIITASEAIQGVNGWTLSSDKKTLTKEYSENKTEEITIKDLVGNETKVNVEISNIDKVAPTANVEYSTTNLTNQNVTVTITANEEVQEIEGWTREENRKILTKEYRENKTEEITIKDLVGNETKVNVEISNIDKVAPTANVEYSTMNLTNQNVTVTITASEAIQGVNGWTLSSDKKTLTKEYSENKTEEITIKDLVGNETKINVEITNIDKVAPVIEGVQDKRSYSRKATPRAVDENLESVKLEKAGQEIEEYENGTEITELGNYKIIAMDGAGNKTEVEFYIKDIPSTEEVVEYTVLPEGLTNQDVKVSVTKKENEEYQDLVVQMSTDGKNYEETTEKTITENGTVYIRIVKEEEGNTIEGEVIEVEIKNIDKTAPKAQVEYSTTNVTNQNVTATIAANEGLQGINGWTLSSDKKTLTKEYSQNKTEEVTIKDLAGNTSIATIKITNIDKVVPTVNVEYSTTNPTNQNVTATITASEALQGVNGWTLSSDRKTLTKSYQSNAEERIEIKDVAGNAVYKNISVKNIDKINPVITGVENGKTYKGSVTAIATDDNPGALALEKDGVRVEGYTNGKEIIEEGTYRLIATDKAGNTTIVNFTIEYLKSDLNENNQIDIGDLLLLLRHIAQANSEKVQSIYPQWKLSNQKIVIGDINKNGTIDIGDVLKLRRYMAAKASQKVADKHPDWLNIE